MQKCMCTFVYVQNECVDMCACICTYTVMVWNHAFAEASWTMIFTVGPYCSIWTGGRECLFCRNSVLFSVIDPVGQAMACSTSGEFRILNSCASMHTHTVHSSMHTEERTQLLPLAELWLYSAFVQFQRDLCQQFYILDKCIWMLIKIKKFCSLACALHAAFLCCKIMWWWFYFNFMNPNMK